MGYAFTKDMEYSKEVLKLSDEQFAELIGTSRSSYSRWKRDNTIPNDKALEKAYSAIYSKGIRLNRVYEDLYLSRKFDTPKPAKP